MQTIRIQLLLTILILNFSSCKDENATFSDYQYADQAQVIGCANATNKLLNEALYSFEKDIIPFYDKQEQNANRAYNTFIKLATGGRKIDLTLFASKHSVALATALKNADIIDDYAVNYKSTAMQCIAENMQKDDLKTTLNALLSTNSMRRDLFNPALQNKSHKVFNDKYLSVYVALEYFYAEILKTDFDKLDKAKIDFNNRPAK